MGIEKARAEKWPAHATVFLEEPPVFTERGNVFYATYRSNDSVFSVAFRPCTFHAGIVLAQAALAKWKVKQLEPVEPVARIGRKRS